MIIQRRLSTMSKVRHVDDQFSKISIYNCHSESYRFGGYQDSLLHTHKKTSFYFFIIFFIILVFRMVIQLRLGTMLKAKHHDDQFFKISVFNCQTLIFQMFDLVNLWCYHPCPISAKPSCKYSKILVFVKLKE